jgi:flagellar hook-associated protein 2
VASTISSGGGTISAIGIGTGMDVNGIITQLMQIERQPIADLQKAASTIQTKISSFGALKSNVSALRDAADALTKSSTWAQAVSTSSDTSAVTTATTLNTTPGTYAVRVNSLASSQSVASGTYASSSATVGEGTLTFELGSWSGTSFTAKSGSSASSVTINAGATLAEIRDSINAASAGVTASLLNDTTGSRLVLRSTETGVENGFRLSVSDPNASGLDSLAYDPGSGTSGMSLAVSAANATGTINGLPVSSATNTFSEVVDGLTLNFSKVTTSDVLVKTTVDKEAIKKQFTAFTDAYNKLNSFIASQTAYDPGSKKGGLLQGDAAANSIRTQMRSLLGDSAGISSTFSRLSNIGVEIQRDGSLTVNSSKVDSALNSLGEVRKMVGNVDALTPTNNGLATRVRLLADQMLSIDGTVSIRSRGLQKALSNNQDRQSQLEDQVAMSEKRLRAQYTALDVRMSSINGRSSLVTQMINQYNANKG